MSDLELKEMITSLVIAQRQTEEQMQETDRRMQETDRRMQETDRRMQETDRRMQETNREWRETERFLRETFAETDRRIREADERMWAVSAETDRRLRETDRHLRKVETQFNINYGRLIEALTEPAALKLFMDRGFQVHRSAREVKVIDNGDYKGDIDVFLLNTTECVAIEVKSFATSEDVKEFRDFLKTVKNFFPEFKNHRWYGAMASLKWDPQVLTQVQKSRLFALRVADEIMEIVNPPDFKPWVF
jgi:hypothetical protein